MPGGGSFGPTKAESPHSQASHPPAYELILWPGATRPQPKGRAAPRAPGRLGRAGHARRPWGAGVVLAPPGPPPSRRLSQGRLRQHSPAAIPGTKSPGRSCGRVAASPLHPWPRPPVAPAPPTLPKPYAASTSSMCLSAAQGR